MLIPCQYRHRLQIVNFNQFDLSGLPNLWDGKTLTKNRDTLIEVTPDNFYGLGHHSSAGNYIYRLDKTADKVKSLTSSQRCGVICI